MHEHETVHSEVDEAQVSVHVRYQIVCLFSVLQGTGR